MTNPTFRDEKSDIPKSRSRQPVLTDNSAGSRILTALAGRPRSWLAQASGLPESTIGDAIKRGPSRSEVALRLAEALDVSVDWLLGRDGIDATIASSGHATTVIKRPEGRANDAVDVAEIDLQYGLGGSYLDAGGETEPRRFSRAWLRHFTDSPPEELFWARGQGNSMEPLIHTNDILLIDRRQNTLRMADLIWAVAVGEFGMIKRLRPMADGSVKILSDNPAVPPETAHDDELHIIGRVVAVVKKL